MNRITSSILLTVVLSFVSLHAEVIQLNSGETIHGKLLSVNDKTLKIRHEIFGDMEIPRDKVLAIVLGQLSDGKLVKPDGTDAEPETPKQVIDRLVNKEFGPKTVEQLEQGAKRQSTPQDAVDQLRREGVDPRLTDQLHLMLPGFGAPEVQDYFNGKVSGLMDGSVTLQDIRKDAINARDQLNEIMEDLGPDAAALQGYFSILDNFIKKTAPEAK
jgi:hypothetical protein